MHIVLAPDSYKGTLSATEVCETMRHAIREEMPNAVVESVPMADGGEGTVDAIVAAAGGRKVAVNAVGPLGRPIEAFIGEIMDEAERCAVIEVASLFGLPMLERSERNPLHTTSRGLGDAIKAALDDGIRRFVVGLGGSATNDGGLGMLAALGAAFTDREGNRLFGFGSDLLALEKVDLSGLDERLRECAITIASDVSNPLLGSRGATNVYGPQKGADAKLVRTLDQAMGRYAELAEEAWGRSEKDTPGAGAAGGLGFALLLLGGNLVPGAKVVEQVSGLAGKIRRADWVVTGEGCSDGQTLYGKLPLHVASLAEEAGKPALLISGSLGEGWESLLNRFAGCLSTVTRPAALEDILPHAEHNLYVATRNVAKLIARASLETIERGITYE